MTQSNVGNAAVYQADDQVTKSDKEILEEKKDERFHEGKENSHKANDSKDERSIANKLAKETKEGDDDDNNKNKTLEQKLGEVDPTLPAKLHGNEPSKGAKIDKQIADEEAAEIAKKDAAKAQSKANK